MRILTTVVLAILAVPLGVAITTLRFAHASDRIVVAMTPCKLKRPVPMFFVSSSKHLVLKGTVAVGNETFSVYLPKEAGGYSIAARPERKGLLTAFTSTWLSVDQDHDGKISESESYYAEHPLRIGDAMFEIEEIAADGTLTLIPSDAPLSGAVIGRKAPEFEWKTIDGEVLRRDDFLGRTVIIDCWAPS